ncbi:unnamed protein product [Lymnaea stagnalis]|uniref:UDP-glucuronosyltransferase n=1 Tax=Lymnaea stagnalis TaxID=6523 RepID=A0AAV2II80_LYMST
MCSQLPVVLALAAMFLQAPSWTQAKKVVMFPPPVKSYILYHSNIGQALMDLGHDVWICLPDHLVETGFLQHHAIKRIVYGTGLGDIEGKLFQSTQMFDKFWAGEENSFRNLFPLINYFKSFSIEVLSETEFVQSVKNINPDLFILDAFMFTRNLLVLPYKLDLSFALIGTLHDMNLARVPYSPAAEPHVTQKVTNRMTFFQRVESTFIALFSITFHIFTDDDVVTRFAPEKPYKPLSDIALQAEIFISDTDHILDYPQPVLPNTKLIGGSSVSESKPLTGDYFNFFNSSVNGVVVVTFGSTDMDVPTHIMNKMVAAFDKLDLNVVWKANLTSPRPDKIMISKWLPQNDLLGHPKTKVFVSHCGKNGQYEALHHTVPILCLPIFGDQFHNAERISVKGFGLESDLRKITSEEFADLIKEVAYNPKYKTNIQKASALFKELCKEPMKEAAYWFDHVMKYGGGYMRSSGQEMPMYQFLLLDVIAFFIGVISLLALLTATVVIFCYRCLRNRKIKAD